MKTFISKKKKVRVSVPLADSFLKKTNKPKSRDRGLAVVGQRGVLLARYAVCLSQVAESE